jgi:NDP-sugar pyrophosphorylase family protein
MAAGRGNRMRPLTDILPKAMVPYKQDTLIGNSLSMLAEKIPLVHVTVGHQKAMLAEYLMMRGVDSVFNTEGHGNAWWIFGTVMCYVDSPVLVLTTDNITQLDFAFLESEYCRCGKPACMLVPVSPVPSIEGDFIDHQDNIVLKVQRKIPRDIYCSGIQVLNPANINAISPQADDFYSVWDALISERRLMVSDVYPNAWFSVDTLEQLANLP